MAPPQIVRRTSVASLALALAVLPLTACSGTITPTDAATSPAPSPAPTVASTGIVADGPSTVGPQPYIRSTIGDDDLAMQLDSAHLTDAAAAYPQDDLAQALAFAVRFAAENVADTPLINADSAAGLAWLDEHAADLTPGLLDDQRERFGGSSTSDAIVPDLQVLNGDAMIDVVYSQTEPRVIDREIHVTETDVAGDGAVTFAITVDSVIQATEAAGEKRPIRLVIDGTMYLAVVKNGDGEWAIKAYAQDVHGQTQVKQ